MAASRSPRTVDWITPNHHYRERCSTVEGNVALSAGEDKARDRRAYAGMLNDRNLPQIANHETLHLPAIAVIPYLIPTAQFPARAVSR